MYTLTVSYSDKTHTYDVFNHITNISYGKGFNQHMVTEKEFTTFNFPYDEMLRLHSAEKDYLIYPNKIIYIEFEKEPD